jgi:hypothetical protein
MVSNSISLVTNAAKIDQLVQKLKGFTHTHLSTNTHTQNDLVSLLHSPLKKVK